MAGGGGAAGKVDFPSHMKTFHQNWLGTGPTTASTISAYMNALLVGTTPYDGESAFDPDTYFTDVNTARSTWASRVAESALNNETVWQESVDAVVAKAHSTTTFPQVNLFDVDLESDAMSDVIAAFQGVTELSQVQDLVDAFENRVTKRQQRAIARFTAGMAENNAVMNSAFTIGLALLEAETVDQVNEFDAKVSQELFSDLTKMGVQAQLATAAGRVDARNQMMIQGTSTVNEGKYNAISLFSDYVKSFAEISRIRTVAKAEQLERDLEIDTSEALWDISVFQYGANFLSSISGAPMVPKGLSKVQSAIGGALSGAGVGIRLGSAIPGVGPVIGGVGGGLIGGLGGLL